MNLEAYPWLLKHFNNINLSNLPHALIINGPEGIGKSILAKEISKLILISGSDIKKSDHITSLINSNSHPDFYNIDKDKIKVGDISRREKDKWDPDKGKRDAVNFLNFTPSISKNKVLLINNADTMNNNAQNAFLKSLEEPASFSYILMTTSRSYSLKSTIYSRCQTINIKNPTSYEIDSWLESKGLSDFKALDFPSYYSPLKILKLIEDNNEQVYKEFISLFEAYMLNKITQGEFIKSFGDFDIDLIEKLNFTVEILKILLSSRLQGADLSGAYKKFNDLKFSNLKISNIINDINEMRYSFFKVTSINESHMFNYLFGEIKSSFKQQ